MPSHSPAWRLPSRDGYPGMLLRGSPPRTAYLPHAAAGT